MDNYFIKYMLQHQSILQVSDNSGAKTVRCIKVLGGFKRKFACLGDTVIVVVSQLRNKLKKVSKVKKGDIFKAVIVKTKKKKVLKDGFSFSFDKNSVVLLSKQDTVFSSRVAGGIPSFLKKGSFSKMGFVSAGVI